MGIALGIASVASAAYGAHKQGQAAEAAKKAAAGAAYVPSADAYKDQGYEERRKKQDTLYSDVGEGSEFGAGQKDLATMLKEKAEGKGNSLAQNTLQAGIENAQASALGSASAQAGAAGGLGLRNILGAQTGAMMGGANTAASLGLKEQAMAQGQLGSVLNQGRAGDQRQNQQLLGILQQQGLEDERNRQALMGRENLIATGKRAKASGTANAEMAIGKAQNKMWSGIGQGFGNMAGSGLAGKADSSIGSWFSNMGAGPENYGAEQFEIGTQAGKWDQSKNYSGYSGR